VKRQEKLGILPANMAHIGCRFQPDDSDKLVEESWLWPKEDEMSQLWKDLHAAEPFCSPFFGPTSSCRLAVTLGAQCVHIRSFLPGGAVKNFMRPWLFAMFLATTFSARLEDDGNTGTDDDWSPVKLVINSNKKLGENQMRSSGI